MWNDLYPEANHNHKCAITFLEAYLQVNNEASAMYYALSTFNIEGFWFLKYLTDALPRVTSGEITSIKMCAWSVYLVSTASDPHLWYEEKRDHSVQEYG
jgi:hypothetical protein